MDLSFHVPTSNAQFIGNEHHTSAQVRLLDMRNMSKTYVRCKSVIFSSSQNLCQEILHRTDAVKPSEAAVVTFDGIAILTPRWEICTHTEHMFGY
jgi:structure-specific recognition protein 1